MVLQAAALGLLLVLRSACALAQERPGPSSAPAKAPGSEAPALHVDFPRSRRNSSSDVFWFEWHGFDYPDSRKLADSARVLCAPPAFVVALSVTVANVTAVPPSWPHLLAGLHVVARTQLLPKAAMIGLDVTCGVSGADAGTTTRLRPDSGPAEVPAYIEGAPTPGLAPGSPGRAAYQGLKPGQDSSQQATVTLPGALTVDAADSTTYAYRSAGPGLQIEGFSRMATVAGTWGWVTNASYPEPRSLVSAADGGAAEADAAYYGDYGENADLHADVTWVDVCPRRTRVVGVEACMAANVVLGLSWGCGCINDCQTSPADPATAGTTRRSNCTCAPFFNITSGSGLVVTESAGACILSDSTEPWCIVNQTTCADASFVRSRRGEPWDYCARPGPPGTPRAPCVAAPAASTPESSQRALMLSRAAAPPGAPGPSGPPLAPILGTLVPAAVLAMLAAVLGLWWRRRRRRELQKLASSEKLRLQSLPRSGSSRAPLAADPPLGGRGSSSGLFPSNMPHVEEYTVKPSDFVVLQRKDGADWLLGQGAFGKVYRGLLDGVQPVAIKIIPAALLPCGSARRASADSLREVALLRQCRCPHIVQFMGACTLGNGDTAILMELMLGGNLYEAIAGDRVSWYSRGRQVAVDVARGLAFLHARSIADLDVKSPNVLLTPARSAKLADFGLARVLLTAATAVTACGSFDWAAPELLMGGANKVSSAADIYSFGVILWELATREAPRRGRMRVPAVPEECPEELVELMHECMALEAHTRPTARELVERLLAMRHSAGS